MSDFLSELCTWMTTSSNFGGSGGSGLAASSTFYGKMPTTPNTCIAVFDSGGYTNAHNPLKGHFVRFLARGQDRSAGMNLANKAYSLVHSGEGSILLGVNFTNYHVFSAKAQSPPQQIGIDANGLPLIAFDVEIILRRKS